MSLVVEEERLACATASKSNKLEGSVLIVLVGQLVWKSEGVFEIMSGLEVCVFTNSKIGEVEKSRCHAKATV